MQRRDLTRGFLFASAAGAAGFAETAQSQTCAAPCYAIVTGEVSASVFQTQYLPGDIRRYYNPAVDANDWTNALSRLRDVGANGIACFIPAGTYSYSTLSPSNLPINWAIPNLQLTGQRGTVLQFTGSGPAFFMDSGGSETSITNGLIVSNITISGTTRTTDGFYARGISHSAFRNIEVRNCTGKAFNIRWGVGNQFDTCFFSTVVFNSTVLPVRGFCLDDNGTHGLYTTTCTFTNCVAEGFSDGIGCEVLNGSGNTFIGCSFEYVGIGVTIESTSQRNRFVNVWFERNRIADAQILGGDVGVYSVGNSFSSCNFGTFISAQNQPLIQPNISIARGQATIFEGGYIRHVDLQSVSSGTLFLGNTFGTEFSPSGITGVGTYKRIGGLTADGFGNVTGTLNDVQ